MRLFYPERTYSRLLEEARRGGARASELSALADWLPGGKIDQKRLDALALLGALRDLLESDVEPKRVAYDFQWTKYWDAVVRGEVTRSTTAGTVIHESG